MRLVLALALCGALASPALAQNSVSYGTQLGTLPSSTRVTLGLDPSGLFGPIALDSNHYQQMNCVIGCAGGPLPASGVASVTGAFTGTGNSTIFVPEAGRPFNISVWSSGGTAPGSSLNATVYLARSTDGGATYLPVSANGTQLLSFTTVAAESWVESQTTAKYELICSAYSTGTINYRFDQ